MCEIREENCLFTSGQDLHQFGQMLIEELLKLDQVIQWIGLVLL